MPLAEMYTSRLSPRLLYGLGRATYTRPAPFDATPVAAPPVRSALHGTVGLLTLAAWTQLEPAVQTHQSTVVPLTERRTPPSASTM